MKSIDHIVYVCQDLGYTRAKFQDLLGINIYTGGRHLKKGTHNALFRIGPRQYFELLAPDPERNKDIDLNWLGTDQLENERISRWCIQPDNFQKGISFMNDISKYHYEGIAGSRKKPNGDMLTWKLGLCNSITETDVFPFLIDWENSAHPSLDMKDECSISKVTLHHACPKKVERICSEFGISSEVISSETPKIEIELLTPRGKITLS